MRGSLGQVKSSQVKKKEGKRDSSFVSRPRGSPLIIPLPDSDLILVLTACVCALSCAHNVCPVLSCACNVCVCPVMLCPVCAHNVSVPCHAVPRPVLTTCLCPVMLCPVMLCHVCAHNVRPVLLRSSSCLSSPQSLCLSSRHTTNKRKRGRKKEGT